MTVDDHRRRGTGLSARCGICTVSDTRTPDDDRSGPLIRERLVAAGHGVVSYRIVPDESEDIRRAVESAMKEDVDCLIVTGGTGISRRDRTPDAVSPLFQRELPGFGELFRLLSYEEIGAAAFLSRATAGIAGRTAVFCLPGSPAAVRLAMDKLLLPELPHIVGELRR